ncbi:zinc-binding dehydrogenase [Streptomyces polygonati]|uniref:Zinc-binding dehydrogenase n=1 Tax=Streptomyces polygonati TaxID=1617087 RepID=A0ABV8HX62_9ACTN
MSDNPGVPETMRALRQPALGGPHLLTLVHDAPVPAPGPGEVLLRVGAAGVNLADVMQTHGTYEGGPQAPYLAGFEGAGTVVALGPGTEGLAVGDRVIGAGSGAFAEYMTLPAAAALPLPEGWSEEEALGLVLNWATALAALRLGRLARGETVLVYAAAGGVGQAAVRLAKHFGATVLACAAPEKHEAVLALGADHVIDYRAVDTAAEVSRLTAGQGADVVLESVGGQVFRTSLAAARPVTGRVVVYGAASGEAAVTNRELNFGPVQLIGLHIGVLAQTAPGLMGELVEELGRLIEAGVYPPGQPTVFDLADGPKALMTLAEGSTVGKLALRP